MKDLIEWLDALLPEHIEWLIVTGSKFINIIIKMYNKIKTYRRNKKNKK